MGDSARVVDGNIIQVRDLRIRLDGNIYVTAKRARPSILLKVAEIAESILETGKTTPILFG